MGKNNYFIYFMSKERYSIDLLPSRIVYNLCLYDWERSGNRLFRKLCKQKFFFDSLFWTLFFGCNINGKFYNLIVSFVASCMPWIHLVPTSHVSVQSTLFGSYNFKMNILENYKWEDIMTTCICHKYCIDLSYNVKPVFMTW